MFSTAAPYKELRTSSADGHGKAIVNSFVISRIDYCNSLLAGAPRYLLDRLQSVLNAAARLLVGAKKYSHISHVRRDRLHWRFRFRWTLLTHSDTFGHACAYGNQFFHCCSSATNARPWWAAASHTLQSHDMLQLKARHWQLPMP